MKKIISIILAFSFLFCGSITVLANSEKLTPRYTYISGLKYGFDIDTDTGISTTSSSFTSYNSNYGKITATIQRKNGSDWENVKSFSAIEQDGSIALYNNWALASNNIYRCEFVFEVYNSRDVLLESVTKYSSIVLFPRS